MKTIIVTGGLGFIGSNLIELLSKKNYFIVNIDKCSYASNPNSIFKNLKNYKFYKEDINNKSIIKNIIAKYMLTTYKRHSLFIHTSKFKEIKNSKEFNLLYSL